MNLARTKLAPTQWQIIWALYYNEPLSQRELMDKTDIPELASVSKHLSVLRRLGLVASTKDWPQRYFLIKEVTNET